MRGDGCKGGPLPAPLGYALLPGCTTHCSQGELVSKAEPCVPERPWTPEFSGTEASNI